MTWPLEGSREIDEGIIISEAMDWCKSPTAIVPYRLYAYQREAMDLADSVKQTSDRTHVRDSIVLKSYGDEPGVGGGVISGTHNAECTPKTWSESVTAEGRNVVRHDDEWWMNHKNTWGKLTYVKDPNQYSSTTPQTIDQKMLPPDADKFEAFVGADDAAAAGGILIIGGMMYILKHSPKVDLEPKPKPKPDPPPGPGFRGSGGCKCITGSYAQIQPLCKLNCGSDAQAHHIVPDYTVRYGSSDEKYSKRIPGLPDYNSGPAICLIGMKADVGSEHGIAHQADSEVAQLGSGPQAQIQGTAPIQSITEVSVKWPIEQQAANARQKSSVRLTKSPLYNRPFLVAQLSIHQ